MTVTGRVAQARGGLPFANRRGSFLELESVSGWPERRNRKGTSLLLFYSSNHWPVGFPHSANKCVDHLPHTVERVPEGALDSPRPRGINVCLGDGFAVGGNRKLSLSQSPGNRSVKR